jgi:hypothetical protein
VAVEVAAAAPTVGLGSELPLKQRQAPDPGAVGAAVRLDLSGQLAEGGQVDLTRISDQAGVAVTNMEPGKRGIRPYFYVDDINAGAARVKELGGEANDPVPGMGWFATCRDPEGNEFGLWQNDPSAPEPTG